MVETARVERIPNLVAHEGAVRLRGARCEACGAVSFPVRDRCIECLGETTEIRFERRAELECFTEVYAGPPNFESPYVAGFVRLSPGDVRTFAYLEGDRDDFTLGSPVEVAVGTIADRDDWVFRPEEHAE